MKSEDQRSTVKANGENTVNQNKIPPVHRITKRPRNTTETRERKRGFSATTKS